MTIRTTINGSFENIPNIGSKITRLISQFESDGKIISQNNRNIIKVFTFNEIGENKQRAFLDKQLEAIEKCLTPVVQAYYSDYNKSLISLTAICDDFHKNQKEVLVLAQRVEDVRQKLSGSHSGIQDLYYEKVLFIFPFIIDFSY